MAQKLDSEYRNVTLDTGENLVVKTLNLRKMSPLFEAGQKSPDQGAKHRVDFRGIRERN